MCTAGSHRCPAGGEGLRRPERSQPSLWGPGASPLAEPPRCPGRRGRAAWGLLPAPGREQLRASGPGTSLRSRNYSRAAPTGFLRARRGGRSLRWREAAARGCLPRRCHPHPRRKANGAQPDQGLSGVSCPEPISSQSAFPKSCKQPPGPVLGRGGSLGRAGAMGPGVGSPTLQVSAVDAVALATGLGWGHFTNEVLSVRVTVA